MNPVSDFLKSKFAQLQQTLAPVGQSIQNFGQNVVNATPFANPTANNGQNFWSSPVAKGLANTQAFIQDPNTPLTHPIPQVTPFKPINIFNGNGIAPKIGNTLVNTPGYIGNTVANIPGGTFNSLVGQGVVAPTLDAAESLGKLVSGQGPLTYQQTHSAINKLGQQALAAAFPNSKATKLIGANMKPQEVLANTGEAGETLLNAYLMGQGGEAVKAIEESPTLVSKILTGMRAGAKVGAAFGTLSGLSSGRNIQTTPQYLLNLLTNIGSGTVGGTLVGGTLSGVTGLFQMTQHTPQVEGQLRDSEGKWTTGEQPVKPPKMPQAQWDFQQAFNHKYNRNPYTPVYPSDLQEAIKYEAGKNQAGLSIRDVNLDKKPLSTSLEPTQLTDAQAGLYDAWKTANPDDFLNKPLNELIPVRKQEGTMHTYDFLDKQGNNAGQISYMLDAPNGAITITGIKSKVAGTGAGSNVVQALKKYAESQGLKLTVTDAEGPALPFWKKMGVEVKSYFPGAEPNVAQQPIGDVTPKVPVQEPVTGLKAKLSPADQFEADMNALSAKNQTTPVQDEVTAFKAMPKSQQYNTKGPNLNQMVTTDGEPLNPSSPYFNVNRYDVSPEAQQAGKETVEALKPNIEKVVGQKLTNKEVQEAAPTGVVLRSPVMREQTKTELSDILATRNDLAKKMQSGTLTKDLLDQYVQVKSMAADAARKLQSFAINASPEDQSTMGRIIGALDKAGVGAEDIAAKAKGVDFNDPTQAANFYREFIKPTAGDWLDLVRYNSMLSSPVTHLVNLQGNTLQAGLVNPLTKVYTGAIDFVRAGITGDPRKAFVGEAPAYLKGMVSNWGEAAKAWGDSMSGIADTGKYNTQNIPLATEGVAGAVYKGLSLPMKLLSAADNFFTKLVQGGEESAAYYRAERGVGTDAADVVSENALKEAKETIFTSPTHPTGQGPLLEAMDHVTDAVNQLRNSDSGLVRWIGKFTLPFVRIATNIAKSGVEYNPVTGPLTMIGAGNKEEQLAKSLIGASIGIGAVGLLGSGRLTADVPSDPRAASAFYKSGRQPWAVKIGDHWVSYDKLPPALSFNFAIISSIDQAMTEGKISGNTADVLLNSAAHFGAFLANASYLKTVGDIYNGTVLKNSQSNLPRIASNFTSQLIPYRALLGWITNMTDQTQRRVDITAGFADQLMQNTLKQIPGLSNQVPPMVDSQGNVVMKTNPLWANFSPYKIGSANPNPQIAQQNEQLYSHDLNRMLQIQKLPNGQLVSAGTPGNPAQYAPDLQSIANTIPKSDPTNPDAKMLKYHTLLMYPQVFQYLQQTALTDANGDPSKVDPLYTAPQDIAQSYMRAESLPPSDSYAKALFKDPGVQGLINARSTYFQNNPITSTTPTPSTVTVGGQQVPYLSAPVPSARAQQLMNAGNFKDPEVKAYLNQSTAYKAQQLSMLAGMTPNAIGSVLGGSGGTMLGGGMSTSMKRSMLRNMKYSNQRFKQKYGRIAKITGRGKTMKLASAKFGTGRIKLPKMGKLKMTAGKSKKLAGLIKQGKQPTFKLTAYAKKKAKLTA